ncbi:MAG: Sua5/YciO/YrdC/YwlC family protein [Bacteroidetes bacterium]|nr:Sua5/YciO/YrdC/YwlC family protein [Bacteroidota bacterium]
MNTEYDHDIKACIDIMKLDGVILYPTDTIWGLGCDATNEKAIDKLFKIKHRDTKKSFVLLMTDVKQLSQFLANPLPDLDALINQFTEPTTIVYEGAINLPNSVLAADGSIAVRITTDPFCRSLIKRLRNPVVSTSANESGHPSPMHYSLIQQTIVTQSDYVVRWRQHDISTRPPSQILKLEKDGTFTKIR